VSFFQKISLQKRHFLLPFADQLRHFHLSDITNSGLIVIRFILLEYCLRRQFCLYRKLSASDVGNLCVPRKWTLRYNTLLKNSLDEVMLELSPDFG
jgi:hypothetical protein